MTCMRPNSLIMQAAMSGRLYCECRLTVCYGGHL